MQQPQQTPPPRPRNTVWIAVVAVLVVIIIALGETLVWSNLRGSDPEQPSPAASSPQAQVTPQVVTPTGYGQATTHACDAARSATQGDDPEREIAKRAMSWAGLSDVDTLREIAARDQDKPVELANIYAYTAALRIYTWCIQHGMK